MRIAVCDDDEREVSRIRKLITEYQLSRPAFIDCSYFTNSTDFLCEIRGGEYDLILLDILTSGVGGIQVAQELRELDRNVRLIFVSASSEFAVESYHVEAYYYLLKPVDADSLFRLLDKIRGELSVQAEQGFILRSRDGVVRIVFAKLAYVEVMNKTLFFHLADGVVCEASAALADFEEKLLSRPEFLKTHRSYLVNLNFIEAIDIGFVRMKDGHSVPVSRKRRSQVQDVYVRFLNQAEIEGAASSDGRQKCPDGPWRILLVDDDPADRMIWVTNDPLNYFALEEVRQQTGCYLQILLSEEKPLRQAISYYFAEVGARQAATRANAGFVAEELEELDLTSLENTDEEAPIINLLNSLVERAIKSNASDIHIEPFDRETKVRMRIDGVILEYVSLQRSVHQPLIARIKIMANLDIAEKRIPQDGHFRVRTENGQVNLRVSIMPTVFGEKAVLRLLTSSVQLDHADQFGMDDESYRRFLPLLNCPNGIIYITGPTGSGKSTTLYMVLEYLSQRMLNISTIEDPVEKNVSGINQTQVNPVAGLTFETGLRALLRQDPDIIMVGETRDGETAGISVRAAITGHMVLSTLHTNDAASSIVRLSDMGVENYLIANSLVGMVAQRLMRKVCQNCSQEMDTTEEERKFLGEDVRKVHRGRGCIQCNNTGYRGRIAVHEIIAVDAGLRRIISERTSMDEVVSYARRYQKMRTLRENGLRLVKEGISTPEELLKIAYE